MDYTAQNKPCQGLFWKNFHRLSFPLAITPLMSYLNGIGPVPIFHVNLDSDHLIGTLVRHFINTVTY
jgi:hypothetical protein